MSSPRFPAGKAGWIDEAEVDGEGCAGEAVPAVVCADPERARAADVAAAREALRTAPEVREGAVARLRLLLESERLELELEELAERLIAGSRR